jgi:hypothetical protein
MGELGKDWLSFVHLVEWGLYEAVYSPHQTTLLPNGLWHQVPRAATAGGGAAASAGAGEAHAPADAPTPAPAPAPATTPAPEPVDPAAVDREWLRELASRCDVGGGLATWSAAVHRAIRATGVLSTLTERLG